MSACASFRYGDSNNGGSAIALQRNGGRPLRFMGTMIACAEGGGDPVWARLRLALYERQNGGYVTEVSCTPAALHHVRPWCHAADAETIDEAVRTFETIAVTPDIFGASYNDGQAFARLFQAAGQMCREAAQEHALRHAIGDFLAGLAKAAANHDF